MSVKKELRKALLKKRKQLHNPELDEMIFNNLIKSDVYNNADTVLLYASLDNEISTDALINYSLDCGKKVALPACLDKNGNMSFYYIKSIDDLKLGYFSLREPECDESTLLTDFNGSICVVPAIAFAKSGHRLGYGKGYYDRFLQNYTSISVGLCYNELIEDSLPYDEFDVAVDYIVTQSSILTACLKEENNGE